MVGVYTPNLVLTSGLMAHSSKQWFGYTSEPCFDEWPVVRTLDAMVLVQNKA